MCTQAVPLGGKESLCNITELVDEGKYALAEAARKRTLDMDGPLCEALTTPIVKPTQSNES